MAMGYCGMKPAERAEEDGKKALAHNCAVPMAAYEMPEKDIHLVQVCISWLKMVTMP
jgi:hypothetical protein